MVCLPVWRDNPWALASALSTIQQKVKCYFQILTGSLVSDPESA